ncbi:hypothetical protein, partial [Acidianus sp. RZ1]
STFFFPIFLIILGVLPVNVSGFQALFLGVQILVASVFGFLRAHTVSIWRDIDGIYRKGDYRTVSLWLIYFALEYLIELMANYDFSPILLDLGVSLLSQRIVFMMRVSELGYG